MRKTAFISVLAMLWALAAQGQTAAQNTGLEVRSGLWNDPLTALGSGLMRGYTPAAGIVSVFPSWSSADVSFDLRSEDSAFLPQEGDGLRQGSFNASSFLRLDEKSAVEGSVSYQRGVKRNVVWNETSDYELLYPYVMADSVGGNLQKEAYVFSGAYSRRSGGWVWSAAGKYRALHEYRTVDPRPRDITSDLEVALSGGRELPAVLLTATARYRKYHQQQSVEFLDPKGANTLLLPFTGLGSDFYRFETTGAFAGTRYRGRGGEFALTASSPDGNRWHSGVKYSLLNVVRHLTGQNEAPITEILTQRASAFAAYKLRESGRFRAGVEVSAFYELRQGRENVIDNTTSGVFRTLYSPLMYTNHVVSGSLRGVLRLQEAYGTWSLLPEAGVYMFMSSYEYPSRNMDFTSGQGSVRLRFARTSGPWMMDFEGGAGYVASLSGRFSLPYSLTRKNVYEAYEAMYGKFTSNRAEALLSARVQRTVTPSLAVFAGAGGQALFFDGGDVSVYARISVGICF